MVRYEIRSLFGTRKLILNDKEARQLVKERKREEHDFIKFQANTLPKAFACLLLSALTLVLISIIISIVS